MNEVQPTEVSLVDAADINVKCQVCVTGTFIEDVFVTAMEGGVNYWADVTDYDFLGAQCVLVSNDDEASRSWPVFPWVVREGIRRTICESTRDNIVVLAAVLADDAGDIDADIADNIIQRGVFGRVVFG